MNPIHTHTPKIDKLKHSQLAAVQKKEKIHYTIRHTDLKKQKLAHER